MDLLTLALLSSPLEHPFWAVLGTIAAFLFLWAWHLNRTMSTTPPEALEHLGDHPWPLTEVKETYERMKRTPRDWGPHLPPKLERRYIVVGGSGLVGGQIVLQLLQRGEDPSAIRIVDARAPEREDVVHAGVAFHHADITSESSTKAAFSAPWPEQCQTDSCPSSSAVPPLTVFHTAAVIRPMERSPLVYDRSYRPNVLGTANVISASRAAGASVLIFTSSCSVALRPVTWVLPPWQRWPGGYAQTMTEDDFFRPLGPPSSFFSNYGRSKAEAERLVCAADSKAAGFRTGAIRPGTGVYGAGRDVIVGNACRMGSFPTMMAPWVQNWVHAGNVALAHLQLEVALVRPDVAGTLRDDNDNDNDENESESESDRRGIAGRPFLVTDPGPPVRYQEFYEALQALAESPVTVHYPPPLLMLAASKLVELWCLALWHVPLLRRLGLREPGFPLYYMQPSTFAATVSCRIDDSDARRSVEEGGIGYRGACTSLEGVCMQLAEWNRHWRSFSDGSREKEEVVHRSEKSALRDVVEVAPEPALGNA